MKPIFVIHTLVFLIGSSFLLKSQPQLPPSVNYGPKDYGSLQPPENYSITCDERGFIYSGNVGGVLQFDGYQWKFIEVVPGKKINDLQYVGNHELAVGGLEYFGLIKPTESGELIYQSLMHLVKDKIEGFEIITIKKVGKHLFFQSENIIFVYDGNKIQTVSPENSFFRGYAAGENFFVRDRAKGLKIWKDEKLSLFAADTISMHYGFFGMISYDKEYYLTATYDAGFYKIHKKTGNIEPMMSFFYEDFRPLIFDLIKLDHNLFAIATANHGLVILDDNLELVVRIGRNEGLKSSYINRICADHSGNIWAATSAGVGFIDIHSPLHYYTEISGLPGNVEDVCVIGTHFYAGSSAGLFLLPEVYSDDQKPWRKIESIASHVYDLDVNEKDVLVASGNGFFAGTLNSFKKTGEGNYQSVRFIKGINKIIAFTPDYFEIYSEDYKLERTLELPFHVQRSHIIEYETTVNGRTRIWAGLLHQGVLRIDISDDDTIAVEIFDENDGLMPGLCRPYNYNGKIIFLTEKGLQQFIPEEEVAKSLTGEQKNDAAFNRGYFDVFEIKGIKLNGKISAVITDKNRLYVVLNDRLCYFDEKGKKHDREFSALNLGRVNQLSAFASRIWMPSADGLAVFDPQHRKKMDHPFQVFFRNIRSKDNNVMTEFFRIGNTFHFESDETSIEFEYQYNTIHFTLASDYFDLNNKLEYSWYLEGSENSWSDWNADNEITLANLHEGDYILHVKARNVYGSESKESTYRFTVLPPWYRTWWAYVLYFLIVVFVIFLAIRISVYRLKQSNIKLENIVKERTAEIAFKNTELQKNNEQILHQKQEITDSINYAKRIQEAILPVKKEINKVFPESFVLFKPKDIVSGDFYWFAHVNQLSIFVCADCTGHGVPGAFMSMICTDKLNHTVLENKITSPSEILREVNQGIKRSLKQENESEIKTKDGMDAAVCAYDHVSKLLYYAGANRPLWLMQNREITEYKPTKTAVGGFTPEEQHFEETKIQIINGDIVYLSTDGYADQFGGSKGKKLMVKAFKELLISVSAKPFPQQHDELNQFIENWRNESTQDGNPLEQVDDMCVMGIKF